MIRSITLAAALFLIASVAIAQEIPLYGVPFDIDPPIQIDGDLADWEGMPNPIVMDAATNITYRKRAWGGPSDLSGTVQLAWRSDGLLLAADVTDDVFVQPHSGAELWRGDHVMLWLDLTPTEEPERDLPGEGQYQVAVSPGSLATGDAQPEVHVFRPEGIEAEGAVAAARRTATGYTVEAWIPFSVLDAPVVQMNDYASFEVAISDSDSPEEAQEQMATRATEPWAISRARFQPLVFGDGNGEGEAPTVSVPITSEIVLQRDGTATLIFDRAQLPPDREPFIFFRARRNSDGPGGYSTKALEIAINGQVPEGDRLTSGPVVAQMKDGRMQTWVTPDGRVTLPWAADYTSTHEHPAYGLTDTHAGEYEFYIGGLLVDGANTIEFRNVAYQIEPEKDIVTVADVELRAKPNAPGLGLLRPAPTGELPLCEPQTQFLKRYELLRRDEAEIEFTVGGETFVLSSYFSAPDGQWHQASTEHYAHSREVIEHDEWIEVRDTFRNLTGENVPVMHQHVAELGDRATGVWLAGAEIPGESAQRTRGDNPSIFVAAGEAGVGLVPLDDVFRVHARQELEDGTVRLADRSFYLRPGTEYTAEWAIVPTPSTDFYDFTNRARRMLDVNFTLPWMFAFHFYIEPVYEWSDDYLRSWIVNKSANLVVKSLYGAGRLPDGGVKRGTLWMESDLRPYVDLHRRVKELFPDDSVKTAIYFHCFLDVDERNEERFAADRLLTADGTHLTYGEGSSAYMKYYVPTVGSAFGAEMERWIDTILEEVGVDGVYWDEFAYARGDAYNMDDGFTADIDPTTMQITRLNADTTLMSRDWRLQQVERIQAEGRPFIVNGMPRTRTLAQRKFQAFTETGSIGNCRHTLLYSPVALGDHLSERTFKDAWGVMLRALDFGCLYNWYNSTIVPPEPTLTEHMFPFTPIELHEGYVIGEERIITNRSGLFGWADDSGFVAYVYDRDGRATEEYPVLRTVRDGRAYAEVRIPEGYAVAIVRE